MYNLTDVEFQSVGTKRLQNVLKNDFKNIQFTLDVKNSNKILNRKITVPDTEQIIKSYDMERFYGGQSFRQDNSQEKFAKYNNIL